MLIHNAKHNVTVINIAVNVYIHMIHTYITKRTPTLNGTLTDMSCLLTFTESVVTPVNNSDTDRPQRALQCKYVFGV